MATMKLQNAIADYGTFKQAKVERNRNKAKQAADKAKQAETDRLYNSGKSIAVLEKEGK